MSRAAKNQNRTLRIIGGKWRGRKVNFSDAGDIRPTGDRIRETLFNWLMHDTAGSTCLDLYAGSGALGIEALSRGAAQLTLVEKNPQIAKQLRQTMTELGAEDFKICCEPALDWLSQCTSPFDIIFLDPPFHADELERACNIISSRELAGRFVYIESDNPEMSKLLPDHWQVKKIKQAGTVTYCLCQAC